MGWTQGKDRLQSTAEQSLNSRGSTFISMLEAKLADWKQTLERALTEERDHWAQNCANLERNIGEMENMESRRVSLVQQIAQLEHDLPLFKNHLAKALQVQRFE